MKSNRYSHPPSSRGIATGDTVFVITLRSTGMPRVSWLLAPTQSEVDPRPSKHPRLSWPFCWHLFRSPTDPHLTPAISIKYYPQHPGTHGATSGQSRSWLSI
ncbi:hypothetical protein M405DRAFT_167028 [Rhizopogon salebrosus TDB-379]|nr:hypothetical protein M405DRAFT_167028 [Rhizopogon salebrosus TDB-379]